MDSDDGTLGERTALQDRRDMQAVLRTVEGRRFIRRLLTEAGLYDFAPQGLDAAVLAYSAGRRDLGLLLVTMVTDADPRSFAQLTNEAALEAVEVKRRDKGDPDGE